VNTSDVPDVLKTFTVSNAFSFKIKEFLVWTSAKNAHFVKKQNMKEYSP
jgi:hypothetical protein